MNHPQQLASERTDIKFYCKFYVSRRDIYFFYLFFINTAMLELLTRTGVHSNEPSDDETSSVFVSFGDGNRGRRASLRINWRTPFLNYNEVIPVDIVRLTKVQRAFTSSRLDLVSPGRNQSPLLLPRSAGLTSTIILECSRHSRGVNHRPPPFVSSHDPVAPPPLSTAAALSRVALALPAHVARNPARNTKGYMP